MLFLVGNLTVVLCLSGSVFRFICFHFGVIGCYLRGFFLRILLSLPRVVCMRAL